LLLTQSGVAFVYGPQTLPQPLQLVADVVVFTSQPSALRPSQSAKPVLQVNEHAARKHVGVAFALPHAAPQTPQLFTS
jgi:hypothetical protein